MYDPIFGIKYISTQNSEKLNQAGSNPPPPSPELSFQITYSSVMRQLVNRLVKGFLRLVRFTRIVLYAYIGCTYLMMFLDI